VDNDADCISCSDADEVLADARDPTEKRIAELEDKVERLERVRNAARAVFNAANSATREAALQSLRATLGEA